MSSMCINRWLLFVLVFCFYKNVLSQNADTVKTKNKDDYYTRLDDKIIISASRANLDRQLRINKAIASNSSLVGYDTEGSGGVFTLQYSRMKFSYSLVKSYNNSDYTTVNANANSFGFSFGFSKLYFAFKYESFFRSIEARNYYSDKSNLHFEEPSLRIKYSPFKTYYVDQLTSANYIQKKTRFNVYLDATPYQRTYFTSDTIVLLEMFGNWPELVETRKIVQRGAILKIGLDGNIVIKKVFYIAGSIQLGINPCYSTKLTFAGLKSNWSAADFVYSYSFGAGLNFNFPLFLKFSFDRDVVRYSSPAFTINDNRISAYLTIGYRFNEPHFLKNTREKITDKLNKLF